MARKVLIIIAKHLPRVPLISGEANSPMYVGTTNEVIPAQKPVIIRPVINMAKF